MFLLVVSSALVIVLAVMFGKDEKGPKKYIEMNGSFFNHFLLEACMRTYLLLLGWVALMLLAIILMYWSA